MTIYKQSLKFSYIILSIHICHAESESDPQEHKEISIKYGIFSLIWAKRKVNLSIVTLNVWYHHFN